MGYTKSGADEMVAIMDHLIYMDPPPEAQRFHNLVFERTQLTYGAFSNLEQCIAPVLGTRSTASSVCTCWMSAMSN